MKNNSEIDPTRMARNVTSDSLNTPSYLIEFAYLGLLLYLMAIGPALKLMIPLVGSGALAGIAVLCLMHFGSFSFGALRPIRFALLCGVSVLFLQGMIFQESLLHPWMRNFLTWVLGLIVIHSLSFRQGFLHRFALVAFVIACATLPFLTVYVQTDDMMRVGGQGMPLGNPNFFGMWFGFCAIYFVVTGLEAKNYILRTASWSAGFLCIYLVAMTVSRGALLGVAIAIAIAAQRTLKRSFLPILGFLGLLWVIYMSGILDDFIRYYMHRGAEETGRSRLWGWALEGIFDSWGLGVGMSNAFYTFEFTGETAGPHNSFLFLLLSSGFLSLGFYIAYLVQATQGAFRARTQHSLYSPYMLPMVSFGLLSVMVADTTFMSPWHMIIFSLAIRTPRVHRRLKKHDPKPSLGKFKTREPERDFA